MKSLRILIAGLVFIVACPLSWAVAWMAGTWFTVLLSLALPTYGGIYWLLLHVMEPSFWHSLLSWTLGFVGAFISLWMIRTLLREGRSEDDTHKWRNHDLGIYFRAKPKDPMWDEVTAKNAETVQRGFMDVVRSANLDTYSNTNSLPSDVVDKIADAANEAAEKAGVKPVFLILLAHQYVDADKVMRQLHKSRWVASMVARSTDAPPPESYLKYIKATYFSGGA